MAGADRCAYFAVSVAQDILTSGLYLHDLQKVFLQEAHVKAGNCHVPFELQLPLDVGPGTFQTRDAEISYMLVVTVGLVNVKRFPNGRTLRTSRKISLFPCLDPQRALVPSQAPIDAAEECKVRFGGKETLKIAARIHRPSWIAGQVAHVDVFVTNDTTRDVFKIQLDLIRQISLFKNAAASSAFQAVDQRVPGKVITKTVCTNALVLKSDKADSLDWTGIKAGNRGTAGCQISVPAGELSVSAGRYFEASYVIQVHVYTKGGHAQLELPITIIHV